MGRKRERGRNRRNGRVIPSVTLPIDFEKAGAFAPAFFVTGAKIVVSIQFRKTVGPGRGQSRTGKCGQQSKVRSPVERPLLHGRIIGRLEEHRLHALLDEKLPVLF